jgi:hypothetical protein
LEVLERLATFETLETLADFAVSTARRLSDDDIPNP